MTNVENLIYGGPSRSEITGRLGGLDLAMPPIETEKADGSTRYR